jgi:hypothetical protein
MLNKKQKKDAIETILKWAETLKKVDLVDVTFGVEFEYTNIKIDHEVSTYSGVDTITVKVAKSRTYERIKGL